MRIQEMISEHKRSRLLSKFPTLVLNVAGLNSLENLYIDIRIFSN